ncbi:MAG: DUF4347 domain-containing protein [Cyanobacteria bacterium P01_F01_bin.150]
MTHFLFIDAAVENIDRLQECINPDTIFHRVDATKDGIEYVTKILDSERSGSQYQKNNFSNVTVSIVANRVPGGVQLGNIILDLSSLERYHDRIQNWFAGTPLTPSHHDRLQFYSNDAMASAEGQELLQSLHRITYATVYASTPKPNNVQSWGSWQLDTLVNTWNTRLLPLFGQSKPPAPESPFNSMVMATYAL